MVPRLKRTYFVAIPAFALVAAAWGGGSVRASQEKGATPRGGHSTMPVHVEAETQGADGHSAGAPANPLKFEPALAFWTLVVFLGLMFVLRKYAWNPLLAALQKREEHLEHVLLETERARNESEALMAEHRKTISRAGDEVRAILDKARQEAQASADQIMKIAQAEAESSRQRAARDIAAARDAALAEIWQKTAEIAVSVAGRVISKELTPAEHHRLVESAISELPSTANGRKGNST
jgi:F-type H+-transporting ATPase subunit b